MKATIAWVFAISLLVGCSTPSPRKSEHFVTKGGGFALKFGEGKVSSCRYSLSLAPRQSVSRTLYLRTKFENPAGSQNPLVTETEVPPGTTEVSIESPEVRGLQSHCSYKVEVTVFDMPDRIQPIGKHVQLVRYTHPPFLSDGRP